MSEARLLARTFHHGALGERAVVRLVQDSLEPAIDVEMSVLGFSASARPAVDVGATPRRALGFPAWALVNRPDEARFALDVMRGFRKAASRVRTKPGHAREAFVEIAETLARTVPAFLPSFWEEAARAFLTEEATAFAAQCFEKAREAERAYALSVDEDQRAAAYLEFALAGAAPAKSIVGYADELAKAYAPSEAWTRFRQLNVHRIFAGLAPFAGLGKVLRKLAKQAGVSERDGDESFVREILMAPALARAGNDFWTTYLDTFARLAAESVTVRDRLLWLFPRTKGHAVFADEWLATMQRLDVVTHVVAAGRAAEWLEKLVAFVTFRGDAPLETPLPSRFFELIEALAPSLRDGEPLMISSGRASLSNLDIYLLDVLEAALAHEIPVAKPRDGDWEDAAIDLRRFFVSDPVHVAAHAACGPLLDKAVAHWFGEAFFEERAKDKPALREPRARAFAALASQLSHGGLETYREALSALERKVTPALVAEFPETARRAASTLVAPSLARTLRVGFLDELTFPVYEALLQELAPKARRKIDLFGAMAHPIVCFDRRVFVFDAGARWVERSLPANASGVPSAMAFLDGDLLIEYRTTQAETVTLWASDPQAPLAGGGLSYALRDADAFPLPPPGGGEFLGTTPVHRGDQLRPDTIRSYLTDGATFWRREISFDGRTYHAKLTEVDPLTGKLGRVSWPRFAVEASEKTDGLHITDVVLTKLPPGVDGAVLGAVDGFVGAIARRKVGSVFEHTRLDGKTRRGEQLVGGILSLPGGDVGYRPNVGWGANIEDRFVFLDEQGHPTIEVGGSGVLSAGFARLPRYKWLPLLTVRHAPSSLALRATTDEAAEAILRAAEADLPTGDAQDDTDACAPPPTAQTDVTTRRVLPGVSDPVLVASVGQIARAAARLARRHARLVTLIQGGDFVKGPDDDAVKRAFFLTGVRGWGDGDVVADLAATGAYFAGEPARALTKSTIGFHAVLELWPKLLCFLTSRAELPATARETTKSLLTGLLRSGLLGRQLTRATLIVPRGNPLLAHPDRAKAWLTEVEGRRCFVRSTNELQTDLDETELEILTPAKGAYTAPVGTTLRRCEDVSVPDDRGFVEAFLAELARRGPARFDPGVAAAAAVPGALDEGSAIFLVAGLPAGAGPAYAHDFLGKAAREALGLRVKDAAAAKARFEQLINGPGKVFFHAAFDVPSPAGFWATADDPEGLAATVAKAARVWFGEQQSFPNEVLVALDKMLRTGLPARELLALLVDEQAPVLQVLPAYPVDQLPTQRPGFVESVVVSFAILVPWLLASFPLGDPLVRALPRGYERVQKALADRSVLLGLGNFSGEAPARLKLLEQVGGTPGTYPLFPGVPEVAGRDMGLAVLIDDERYSVRMAFRPALVPDDPEALRRLVPLIWNSDVDGRLPGTATLFLQSPACSELVAEVRRLTETMPASPTASLADPRVSAPATVAAVGKKHGLGEDAATLYLQILALPNPTQKNVCAWNDWAAPRYKAAAKELATASALVVEGKRERAGRELFLPGGWEKLSGVFMETWKHGLYQVLGGAPAVAEPYGALFARTFARSVTPEGPRFEDTAAVIAAGRKKGKTK